MDSLTGTLALARLALRLDRVRLTVWVLGLAVLPMSTAANYFKLYPTQADLRAVSGVLTNPSLVALSGPLFDVSIGGLTAWKIGVTEFILVALMSLLTVVRHTRADEETGRLELVGAAVVGRLAPLTAALLVTVLANLAVAVLTALGLLATGLPAAGSVAFGLATGLAGCCSPRWRRRPSSSPRAPGRPPASPAPSSAAPICCAPSATPGRRG